MLSYQAMYFTGMSPIGSQHSALNYAFRKALYFSLVLQKHVK